MSYQQFSIPPDVLVNLYKNNLVIIGDQASNTNNAKAETPVQKPQQPKKWYLGDHKRQLTVIVQDADNLFMGDEDLQFLSKILEACRLNLSDIAIVNLATQPADYQQLKTLDPKSCIFFGVDPAMVLPFQFPQYKQQVYDGCTYIAAASLQQMRLPDAAARAEKAKLWACLKELFNI